MMLLKNSLNKKSLKLSVLVALASTVALSGCVAVPYYYDNNYQQPQPYYQPRYQAPQYQYYQQYPSRYYDDGGYSQQQYYQPQYQASPAYDNGVNVPGALIGGAAGGILGSTIGRGNGRVASTAIGAGLGAVFGSGWR